MQGRIHRPALFRAGEGRIASPEDFEAWLKTAKPGERCVYASGTCLPKGLAGDMARRAAEQGRAHTTQARTALGFDYVLQIADPARTRLTIAQKAAAEERRTETALLVEIEAWLAATATPPSVFGLKIASDAKFVWRMRSGLKIKRAEMDAARAWIAAHPAPETLAVSAARKAVG